MAYMATCGLWPHQERALSTSVESDFCSGTHAHATGTGKSILGHALVRSFASLHPGKLMIWLCEQQSVVSEIFSRSGSRSGIIVCDLVSRKNHAWWRHAQEALIWGVPVIVIVNRAYLVSEERYKKLVRCEVGLVIHDECHSGTGQTTRNFYAWLDEQHPHARVLGLSATPPDRSTAATPALARIASRFSIYDATREGIIVPLKMYWRESDHRLDEVQSAELCRDLAKKEQVRKIIVWCGTIEHCFSTCQVWTHVFAAEWLMAVDTSRASDSHASYEHFVECKQGVLFCAAKHREGSDVPGLGMAVFADGVASRGSAVFVQCAGRVLRRPTEGFSKTHGIVVDLTAGDGMQLCDRVGDYLQLPAGHMPWQIARCDDDESVRTLTLVPGKALREDESTEDYADAEARDLEKLYTRPCPSKPAYQHRHEEEMGLIASKGLVPHLMRAMEVLKLAGDDVPHVTRGSCGSSLVCYLLGISHVDPVLHGICFSRFLNEYRDSLPDIDFDFPYNRRAEIFLRMAIRWPGKIARISNHVHFHEKSALREALRRNGHRGAIPSSGLQAYLGKLTPPKRQAVLEDARALDGKFNCYSLHCGGVVYYPEGVPKDELLEGKTGRLLTQVRSDKRDTASSGHFKIDVLSSRALAQLAQCLDEVGVELELDKPPFTPEMELLLANGDNIGITLAESPLCRAELMDVKPKSVRDIAAVLAGIRPAARQQEATIVYDDDAIDIIREGLDCSEGEADQFRRKLAKRDEEAEAELFQRLGKARADALLSKLGQLSLYGFCKAHAMSYAQLVCWLTWCKAHHPRSFWRGAINHCDSSYRNWVHEWEGSKHGVDARQARRASASVFAEARSKRIASLPARDQLRKAWRWDMREGFIPGCYARRGEDGLLRFRGVIASTRMLSDESLALTIGTGEEYIDVICNTDGFHGGSRIAEGTVGDDNNAVCRFTA